MLLPISRVTQLATALAATLCASGLQAQVTTILHNFGSGQVYDVESGDSDIDYHNGPVSALAQGRDGNFYFVTPQMYDGKGSVAMMTPQGTVTILHDFPPTEFPVGSLTQGAKPDAAFYGVEQYGGTNDYGTFYSVDVSGNYSVIYNFGQTSVTDINGHSIPDGIAPGAGVVLGPNGKFYGTTTRGGSTNAGTIYSATSQGVTIIHSLGDGTAINPDGSGGASDGYAPSCALVAAADGKLYGLAQGGSNDGGVAFSVSTSGTLTVLHQFGGTVMDVHGNSVSDGTTPCGLIQGTDHNFYGTTQTGGAYGFGTVFSMTAGGQVTILYSFGNPALPSDPQSPTAGVVQGNDGNFYGTTNGGGLSNAGAAFKITSAGTLTVLHFFNDATTPSINPDGTQAPDGNGPMAGLALGSDGNFYGAAAAGGTSTEYVEGTLFKIATVTPTLVRYSINGDPGDVIATTLQASNGPTQFSSPNLPLGLSLDPTTGALTGALAYTGTYSVIIELTNAAGSNFGIVPISVSGTVYQAGGSSIDLTLNPNPTTPGQPPDMWTISPTPLPNSLTFNENTGQLSGQPTAPGTYDFTVDAYDGEGDLRATSDYEILVAQPPTVTNQPTPQTVVAGSSVTFSATASGYPVPTVQWQVSTNNGATYSPVASGTTTPYAFVATSGENGDLFRAVFTSANVPVTSQGAKLTVLPGLSITTTTLPSGTVGKTYSQTLAASGGTSPYVWSVTSGSLPPGLFLSPGGVLSGSPKAAGQYPFTAKVTDSSSATQTQSFSVTIGGALSITTASLPGGTVGTAYSQTLAAAGGTAPYTWKVTQGNLPSGLHLSTLGTLSGTPTTAGSFSFTAQVTDSSNTNTTASYTLTVVAPLSITTSSLPGGQVGTSYSQTLAASGGTAPYTWQVSGGTLPAGVSLTSQGVLSGTPATAGTSIFTVEVTDQTGLTASTQLTLQINDSAGATQVSVASASVPYNGHVQTVNVATVPQGLQVKVTYTQNGKPASPINVGTYLVTATITSSGYSGSGSGMLTILPAQETVQFGSLTAPFTGRPIAVTALASPVKLPVTISYQGTAASNKPPIAVGPYTVFATITNPNYSGSASGTFTITRPVSFGNVPATPLLSASGAQVGMQITPGGIATMAYFIYGTSSGNLIYSTKPQSIGAGKLPVNFSGFLGELQPNTTYYYEVVTESAAGTFASLPQSLTTLPGFDTTMVAFSSHPAPGLADTFLTFAAPLVDQQDGAAFYATIGAPGMSPHASIWANEGSATLALVAQVGGGATYYKTLSDPVYDDNEDVAFAGTFASGASTATGVWLAQGGAPELLASTGLVAPGIVGATVQSLHALALSSSGGAIISGTLAANKATGIGPANDLAIWEGTSANDLTVMLRNGETTSTGTIATYTFLPATKIVSGATRGFGPTTGHLTAKVTYTNKATDSGIVAVSEPGAPVALASAGETAPVADAATFTAFSSPAINDSDQVAFAATLSGAVGNNSGIFAGDGSGNLRLVARKGDPNFGFVTLGDPVINDQGAIAFSATFTSGGKLLTGLFSTSSGSLRQIAQTGQQAPGCATGVTFSSFTALALDDVTRTEQQGGVVFLAALSGAGANQGLFTEDAGGNLQLLVRTGDTFNVGTAAAPVFETIASLLGTPPSASAIVAGQPWSVSPATGDVIYTATFTDKKQAIFNVVFPHS